MAGTVEELKKFNSRRRLRAATLAAASVDDDDDDDRKVALLEEANAAGRGLLMDLFLSYFPFFLGNRVKDYKRPVLLVRGFLKIILLFFGK